MIKKEREEGSLQGNFYLSCERAVGGLSLLVGGIIGVSELDEGRTELLSHSGRIIVSGRGLKLTVFENKIIEIKGRIEGINFAYGKA